jgi:Ca-activated chloride channel family protein
MKSWVRVLPAVLIPALLQAQALADQPTYRSATELVSLNVSVVDQHAKPVSGLTVNQFQVFEDGVPQQVKFFAPGEMPLDVIILLDISASMTGSMSLVQQAASRFAHSLRPHDRVAVMGISGGLRILQPFTSDISAVEAAIRATRPEGRTPLYASIYTALSELAKERSAGHEARRQAIVVLSDGQDTSSTFTFDEMLTVVRRHAVPIYTIAPRPSRSTKSLRERLYGESTSAADFELKRVASETGARSFFPMNLTELAGVYDVISSELAHQYSLGYQSSSAAARNGSFRRIALKIDVPGVIWRTRSGYIAERTSTALDNDDSAR